MWLQTSVKEAVSCDSVFSSSFAFIHYSNKIRKKNLGVKQFEDHAKSFYNQADKATVFVHLLQKLAINLLVFHRPNSTKN